MRWTTPTARSSSPRCMIYSKTFERAMLALAIVCMIVVLIIVLATDIGNEFRPTV